jgi:hypothetical protein
MRAVIVCRAVPRFFVYNTPKGALSPSPPETGYPLVSFLPAAKNGYRFYPLRCSTRVAR